MDLAKLCVFCANVPHLPTCLRALRTYVSSCHKLLSAYAPPCLRALIFHVPTCLRADMPVDHIRAYLSSCLKFFLTYMRSFFTYLRSTTTQHLRTDIYLADGKCDKN